MKEEETKLKVENPKIQEEALQRQIAENLSKKGIKCTSLKVDDFGDGVPTEASKYIETCKTLNDVRKYLSGHTQETKLANLVLSEEDDDDKFTEFTYGSRNISTTDAKPSHTSYASQKVNIDECDEVSYEKVNRIMARKAKAVFK